MCVENLEDRIPRKFWGKEDTLSLLLLLGESSRKLNRRVSKGHCCPLSSLDLIRFACRAELFKMDLCVVGATIFPRSPFLAAEYKMIFNIFSVQENGHKFVRLSAFISMRTIKKLRREGRIVLAPFNRDEVTKRAGNSKEYQASAEENISLGLFLGYSDMPVVDALLAADRVLSEDDLGRLFTLEHPLYISEGGHRLRWLDECEESGAPIAVSFLLGDDAEAVREIKAKKEFYLHNTRQCPANAGEVQRVLPTDPQREIAQRVLNEHITEFCPATKSDRENKRMITNAIVNAFETKNFAKLHTKKSTVEDTRTIVVSPETVTDIQVITNELDMARNYLTSLIPSESAEPQSLIDARNAFSASPRNSPEREAAARVVEEEKAKFKATKKMARALQKRNSKILFELDLYGPLLYGLYGAHDNGNVSEATQTIKRWFEKCVSSPEVWDELFAEVTRATSTARSFTEVRYRAGWNAICEAVDE